MSWAANGKRKEKRETVERGASRSKFWEHNSRKRVPLLFPFWLEGRPASDRQPVNGGHHVSVHLETDQLSKVGGRQTMNTAESKCSYFEVDSGLNREPMKRLQLWHDVICEGVRLTRRAAEFCTSCSLLIWHSSRPDSREFPLSRRDNTKATTRRAVVSRSRYLRILPMRLMW